MQIRWSEGARRDRTRVIDWYAEYSVVAGERIAQRILQHARMLARFPRMGYATRTLGTYHLTIAGTPLLLAYRIDGDAVSIVRVLHASQDWPGRF